MEFSVQVFDICEKLVTLRNLSPRSVLGGAIVGLPSASACPAGEKAWET
jgi:hypothetical protein